MAVYAGRELEDAKKLLVQIEAAGHFPGANIRKMQAKRVSP